ncbi:MAG: aminotransferase class V-fold PLP-dependent enzyme [Bdellovibrionales bacterium]|nr:aminotransferase class V-fold PLP-dependent enzyme [Bdellovibrionales bacterium]
MQAQQFIYADYNATAPVPERVREAMQPYLAGQFGNPSSQHSELGRQARAAVEDARLSVAELIGAQPDEIVFTSGGTESAFAALVGAARGLSVVAGSLLLTSSVEHPAVREAASFVEETYGLEVLSIPVDRGGMLQFDAISQEALDRVALVSIMHANN